MNISKGELAEALLEQGKKLGADLITVFEQKDIVYDPRTFLKCLFGCSGGYKFCLCRNDPALFKTYTEIVQKYEWGILICTDDLKTGQKIALDLEKQAFLSGRYFATAFTECAICKDCQTEEGKDCVHPKTQRLPLYAPGIDVYKTVRGLGWELEVVQTKDDPRKNITAVFVE